MTNLLFLLRFPGGLKERPAKLEHAKDPTSALRRAVYGMLPKNKLRKVLRCLVSGAFSVAKLGHSLYDTTMHLYIGVAAVS